MQVHIVNGTYFLELSKMEYFFMYVLTYEVNGGLTIDLWMDFKKDKSNSSKFLKWSSASLKEMAAGKPFLVQDGLVGYSNIPNDAFKRFLDFMGHIENES